MTDREIECVPNFSEGRDATVITRLHDALSGAGVQVLDVHSDPIYHRSVLTAVGTPDALTEALFEAVAVAIRDIDLRVHKGAHPRMGAADVIPFVPMGGAPMQTCVDCAKRLALRVAEELDLPVYLYGHAAQHPDHESVATIRRLQGEQWPRGVDPTVLSSPPDFGPSRPHPTAGAVAIGARPFMIAFNVALATTDRSIAARIAQQIRASRGGLPGVQARAFTTPDHAHVSMNLHDLDATPPIRAFVEIERLAASCGLQIAHSEIVGLIPEKVLSNTPTARLRLTKPAEECVLERRLEETRGRTR